MRALRDSRHIRSGAPARLCAGASLLLLAWTAQAACTAPPELSAKLKAQPTSQNYAAVGNWFADKQQFDCAADAFSSAFARQPNSASLAYLWGLSLYSGGDASKAEGPLRTAEKLDGNDIRPRLVMAALLDHEKKTPEAEAEWRAALAIDPESATALTGLAQDLNSQKDYAGAIALLQKSSARTAEQSLQLGVAYVGSGQLDAAIKVLRDGLNDASGPNEQGSLPLADELALVLMLHGREQEALAVLDLALAKHPADLPTEILQLRMLVSTHSAKATETAKKLMVQHPDQWELLYLSAIIDVREANFTAARASLTRSIELNPDYYPSQAELGSVLAKLDDLAGARMHLEKAIAMGDEDMEPMYELAKVLQRLGDAAGARERLQAYQKLSESRSGTVQAAGKAQEADQALTAGNAALAADLYREALQADPNEALICYKLSRALDKLQDLPGERAALEQAIALDPRMAEAQNQLGYMAVREGDAARAEIYFHAAVAATPSYVAAWINLAATEASEEKWQAARADVAHALQVDPENADARRLSHALATEHPTP